MNFYNMIKKGYVNLKQILIDNQELLKLSSNDIKVIDYLIKLEESIIIGDISNNTNINPEEVKISINYLIKQNYLELDFKEYKGKLQESYTFKELAKIIFKLFSQKMEVSNEKTRLIKLFEERTNKQITHLEIQMIHSWFEKGNSESDILETIKEAIEIDRLSVKYVDSSLLKTKKATDEFEEGKGELIYEFCTQWKNN